MAAPQIHTYHCLCTSLLLATTHTLSSLPHRAAPCLDSAIIVPIPPAPLPAAALSPAEGDSEDEDEDGEGSNTKDPMRANKSKVTQLPEQGYTLLLSTTLSTRPTLIRRSDGFEKRYLLRCGRCKLVVGYELDAEHFDNSSTSASSAGIGAGPAMDVDGENNEAARKGKEERTKIVYLLPSGIMSTEVMASGKKIGEKEVVLGEGEQIAVAAWE